MFSEVLKTEMNVPSRHLIKSRSNVKTIYDINPQKQCDCLIFLNIVTLEGLKVNTVLTVSKVKWKEHGSGITELLRVIIEKTKTNTFLPDLN